MYLSGSTRQYFKYPDIFGCMFNAMQRCGRQNESLESGCYFMVDNGIYSNKWDERIWINNLKQFTPYLNRCIGCIVPDFLYYTENGVIGDYKKTIERFFLYYKIVRDLGFKVAFATQDGLTIKETPFELFDVLFIGGSDYHKRGNEAYELAMEAKKLKKWVHVGRVSSVSSIKKYWWYADSWDGTTFRFEPDKKEEYFIPRFKQFLEDRKKQEKYLVQERLF